MRTRSLLVSNLASTMPKLWTTERASKGLQAHVRILMVWRIMRNQSVGMIIFRALTGKIMFSGEGVRTKGAGKNGLLLTLLLRYLPYTGGGNFFSKWCRSAIESVSICCWRVKTALKLLQVFWLNSRFMIKSEVQGVRSCHAPSFRWMIWGRLIIDIMRSLRRSPTLLWFGRELLDPNFGSISRITSHDRAIHVIVSESANGTWNSRSSDTWHNLVIKGSACPTEGYSYRLQRCADNYETLRAQFSGGEIRLTAVITGNHNLFYVSAFLQVR